MLPQIPQLDLRGHFEVGKREGKGERGKEKEGKGQKGRENTPCLGCH